jgi:hypothetical protein
MMHKEFKIIEKEINLALANFSVQNSIEAETHFRKEFHTKFFEKLKEGWNNNAKINSKISIKYGLIHNSVHTIIGDDRCEIGDFLFVVKNNGDNFNYLAKSLLLQVKSSENRDGNVRQKNLYSRWPEFIFKIPKNIFFLNDGTTPEKINISKKNSQSVYFEYSKVNINSPEKYLIKEIKYNEAQTNPFELYDTKYFSNFFLNLLFNNEGRPFFYSEECDLSYRKFYCRTNNLNSLTDDCTCGIQFSDDWDFVINSIINYSNNKISSNVQRQSTANLNFIALTDNPVTIENQTDDDKSLRIVEIEIKKNT